MKDWTAYGKDLIVLASMGYFGYQFFPAEVISAGLWLAGYTGLGLAGYSLYSIIKNWGTKWDNLQRFCSGTHIMGAMRSGKTTLLYSFLLWLFSNNHNGSFVSSHGIGNLLDLIPLKQVSQITLISPSHNTRGLNFFHRYKWNTAEREVLASQFVRLVEKCNTSWGDNIELYLLMAAQAILEWQEKTRKNITIYDIDKFLSSRKFQLQVCMDIENEIVIKTFEKPDMKSIHSALRKVRTLLANKSIANFINDPDGIDIGREMALDNTMIFNFSPDDIGVHAAEVLAEVASTQLINVGMTRNNESKFYAIILDECQAYGNRILQEALEQAGKRKLMLVLANHRYNQLPKDLQEACDLCGNKYYFRLRYEDAAHASKEFDNFYRPEEFVSLPDYHYLSREKFKKFRHMRNKPIPLPVYQGHKDLIIRRNQRNVDGKGLEGDTLCAESGGGQYTSTDRYILSPESHHLLA